MKPLSKEQADVLEFIKKNGGMNTEELANRICDIVGEEYRSAICNAIEFLVWNGYCERNAKNGAIYARDIPPAI